MKKTCEQCGEELFGAVNRCWQCGAAVVVAHSSDVPPIRRRPVDLSNASAAKPASVEQALPFPIVIGFSDQGRRRCAIASVILGSVGCLLGIATGWAIVLGALGIAFGVLGMPAKHRDLATMGLVLCVLTLFLGFWQVGYDVWVRYASQRWLEDLQGTP